MDNFGILIAGRMILAGLCFGGAAYVASTGNEGWGWLIFGGVVMGAITFNDGD